MSHINVFASVLLNDVSSFDDGYGAFTYIILEGYQYADRNLTKEYSIDGTYLVRTVYAYNTNAITTELNYFDGRVHTNYYSNVDNYFSIVPIGGLTNGLLTIDGETWSGVNTLDGLEEIIDEIFQQRLNENPITRIHNYEDYGIYTNTYGLTYNPTNQIFESNLFGYNGIIFKEFTFDWEPPSSQVYEINYTFSTNIIADPNYDQSAGYDSNVDVSSYFSSASLARVYGRILGWFVPEAAWLNAFTNSSGEIYELEVEANRYDISQMPQAVRDFIEQHPELDFVIPEYGWKNDDYNRAGVLPSSEVGVLTNSTYRYRVTANQDVIIPNFGYNELPESYANWIGRPVNTEHFPSAILNKPAQITKLYALDRDTLIEITFFDSAVISNNGIENIFEQFNTYRPTILSANLPEPIDAEQDTDGDGLSDWYEINFSHTEPADMDSDDDGLTDGYEVNTSNTNPNKIDSDDDGLSDGSELFIHITHPNEGDTDNDGLMDGFEVNVLNSDPSESSSLFFTHTVTNTITNNVGGYSLSDIKDLRVGSQTFDISNGNAKIRMFVDESSDLTSTWSNTQHVLELDIPADADTKFYRFRMD